MLYDPVNQFIFVHTWKTGGESIVGALQGTCPIHFRNKYVNKAIRIAPGPARALLGWRADLVVGQHSTASQIQQIMPPSAFDDAFKFGFVRNPWDWQVSSYFYAIQTKAHPSHSFTRELGSFEAFIRYQHEHGAPAAQSRFLYDDSDRCLVDFVGRFENIREDFQTICQKIGIEAALPHLNASKRKRDWRSYYSDETKDLVADLFRRDIEEFGYVWDT